MPANAFTVQFSSPSDTALGFTRQFNAPRRLVFEALTTPALIKRWLLGPDGWSMPVCEVDLRVGGAYRYLWLRDRDGTTMGMGGVYREITPPDRIVVTETFDEAWYPGQAVVTYTLVEHNGVTTMTATVLYQSREARDAVQKSGMERGVVASYDRLEEILLATYSR